MGASSDQRAIKAQLKPSPSLIYTNLAPLVSGGFAYAHTRQIVTVDGLPSSSERPAAAKRVNTQDNSPVQTVASGSIGDASVIVLGNSSGLQVWDESGTSLLYVWRLPRSRFDPAATSHTDFVRGVCFCLAADGSVCMCAGASSGTIYAFHVSEGPTFRPVGELEEHQASIMALGSAYQSRRGVWADDLGCELVSSDERGRLVVWEAPQPGEHRVVRSIDGSAAPCCSLAVRAGIVVCGCTDGAVRLYGLHDGALLSDIMAHSRWLSAMDIHPTRDIIATCSEDCTVAVWALPIKGQRAACLLSACWLNALMTGVAFCGAGSEQLAAVAYDQDEMSVWTAAAWQPKDAV